MVEFNIKLTDAPWQYDWLLTGDITGTGFIVRVAVIGSPEHVWLLVVNEGETVIIPWIGWFVVFDPIKLGIVPVPLLLNPIVLFEFVQSKTVPTKFELKLIGLDALPLQIVWLEIVEATGVGSTVILKVRGFPVQVIPALV